MAHITHDEAEEIAFIMVFTGYGTHTAFELVVGREDFAASEGHLVWRLEERIRQELDRELS